MEYSAGKTITLNVTPNPMTSYDENGLRAPGNPVPFSNCVSHSEHRALKRRDPFNSKTELTCHRLDHPMTQSTELTPQIPENFTMLNQQEWSTSTPLVQGTADSVCLSMPRRCASLPNSPAECTERSFATSNNEQTPKQRRSIPKSNPTKIRRPMNAFLVWSTRERKKLAKANPDMNNAKLSTLLGKQWRGMSKEEKVPFHEKAEQLKLELREMYPDYKYQPNRQKKKNNPGPLLSTRRSDYRIHYATDTSSPPFCYGNSAPNTPIPQTVFEEPWRPDTCHTEMLHFQQPMDHAFCHNILPYQCESLCKQTDHNTFQTVLGSYGPSCNCSDVMHKCGTQYSKFRFPPLGGASDGPIYSSDYSNDISFLEDISLQGDYAQGQDLFIDRTEFDKYLMPEAPESLFQEEIELKKKVYGPSLQTSGMQQSVQTECTSSYEIEQQAELCRTMSAHNFVHQGHQDKVQQYTKSQGWELSECQGDSNNSCLSVIRPDV